MLQMKYKYITQTLLIIIIIINIYNLFIFAFCFSIVYFHLSRNKIETTNMQYEYLHFTIQFTMHKLDSEKTLVAGSNYQLFN